MSLPLWATPREDDELTPLRSLGQSHRKLLSQIEAGRLLFLILQPGGERTYDFGPDEVVPSEIVDSLVKAQAIEFYGSPASFLAMHAKLTVLGCALLQWWR